MLKPRDYDNTTAYGEFTPLELGGHICVIKSVEETKSKSGKDMLIISLDTAPQDKQPGYYTDMWRQDTREEKKWGCRVFQMVYDQDGRTNRGFKTFCTAAERSNNGFQIQWGDGFAACFKNKLIGGVFGREEYIGSDGKSHWAIKCVQIRSVEAIQEGVEVPEDRRLKPPASAKPDIFDAIDESQDGDLPF